MYVHMLAVCFMDMDVSICQATKEVVENVLHVKVRTVNSVQTVKT